ncbi:pre-mRNA-processing factor 19 [Anaeramoeba flamelloides]|uniref:Pre-mRNA-processing factor 19 n=1 Tax=Anaeramoeba flamelloides TaxID=1746091 RepID=A0ABQ8XR67_9EUKA|nr:pre-mRNA-processing factor 19 [Anaeramoeba flamelloides]
MFCSLSGEPAKDPVITKSGYIFERRLIEKYIESKGSCPVTQESLEKEDLVSIKVPKTSNPIDPKLTSIPQFVEILQTEWDSLVVECFELKKSLQKNREELAKTLYEYDAACRVIARLITERDEARDALSKYQLPQKPLQMKNKKKSTQQEIQKTIEKQMEIELQKNEPTNQIPKGRIENIVTLSKRLSTERKKMRSNLRKKHLVLPKVQQFKQKYTNKNVLGEGEHCIKTLDTIENIPNIVITLGSEGGTSVSDYSISRTLAITKKKSDNNCLLVHPTNSLFLLGTAQGCVECYNYNIDKSVKQPKVCESNFTMQVSNPSPIMGMSLHPDKKTLLTYSKNNIFQLSDLETQKTFSNHINNNNNQITSSCIHPDGILFLFGTQQGEIHLWDVRSEQIALTLSHNNETQIDQIISSNYGIHLGSVTSDSQVNIWDLREQRVLQTFGKVEKNKPKTSIDFDQTGSHLCIGFLDTIQIVESKNWNVIKELKLFDKSSSIQDLSWGKNEGITVGSSKGVIEHFSIS